MPNEDIDVSNLERLEKYRSFDRYRRRAEQEARAPHWWRTYREHFVEESGTGRAEQGPHRRPRGARGDGPAVPGFFTPGGPPAWKIPPRSAPTIGVPPQIFLLLKSFPGWPPRIVRSSGHTASLPSFRRPPPRPAPRDGEVPKDRDPACLNRHWVLAPASPV